MTEKKKVITKTVNRSGKSLVKKALVVKTKTQSNITSENIKKMNEKVALEKIALDKKKSEINEIVDTKAMVAKEDKKYNLTIGLKDLLAAGSHLGHKISKTHPKALENVYTQKDGVQVFDLVKTLESLEKACNFIYNSKRNGKQIVLVGTKRQAREVVRRVAMEAGVPYVTDRWLGGTISNWDQIKKNVKKLTDLREGLEKGKFVDATKKELSQMNKEIARLEKIVGGLVGVDKFFDILFVVDAGFEKTAIKEAKLRNVKVVGIVDSDANPFKIDFAVPANDDSVKSVTLIVEEIGKAIKAAGVK
ncbi:MAG: 30S ribosomal protein S2 [Candidatus Shapirobacteria bacterium]|nr:30S ribosomal protein S2 [Candidatus Shapirobacteria bacterium]MDD3002243.1 30S ribosomal protein S2 [Candidatus Shapirobacteria bacterium]MDD4382749.1 30S ribosomal protein S2 [Candidatus Shapirobacteria bacterium]